MATRPLSRQKLFQFVVQHEMEQLLAGWGPCSHIGISNVVSPIPIWRHSPHPAKSCSIWVCKTKWNNFWRDGGHVAIYVYQLLFLRYPYGDTASIPPKVVPFRFAKRNGTTFGGMKAMLPYRYIKCCFSYTYMATRPLSRQKLFQFVVQHEMEQLLAGWGPCSHIGISNVVSPIPIWRHSPHPAKSCSIWVCKTKWNNFWRDGGHVAI